MISQLMCLNPSIANQVWDPCKSSLQFSLFLKS